MYCVEGYNLTDIFYKILNLIGKNGSELSTWKGKVLEINPLVVKVERPYDRCLIVPGMQNNIIASLAETLWVLGGRNDMKYLKKYVFNAMDFSDDGEIWRAAYGPRIHQFHGINQMNKALNYLRSNPNHSASLSIFDPECDYEEDTRDYPCTNMIQFSIKNGELSMTTIQRSSDLMLGFCAANYFEWSLLHEVFAFWMNLPAGPSFHLIGNMCLFERYFGRKKKIMDCKIQKDIYSFPEISQISWDLKEDMFQEEMEIFFKVEELFTENQLPHYKIIMDACNNIKSKFLRHSLYLMFSYLLFKNKSYDHFLNFFSSIYTDVYKLAAADFYIRKTTSVEIKEELTKQVNFNSHWGSIYA